jgi:acetylornithine deacetylase/succinyl-diaminopimelate desuccinylase-like protein
MRGIPSEYKSLFKQFLAFKSVSTDPNRKKEIEACVDFLRELFVSNDFQIKIIREEDTNPILYTSKIINHLYKTILIYGHYDVQPALIEDGWEHDPFQLREQNGRLSGRGAIDNKGQLLVHIYNVFELMKAGKLLYNIIFLIEGNEETGSARLHSIIKENKAHLNSDLILISDGTLSSSNPVIEISLRGHAGGILKLNTANSNVHSGIYGNSIPNANHELTKLIGKMFGKKDKINIPLFNTKITEKAVYDRNSKDEIRRKLGLKETFIPTRNNFHSFNGLAPALIVTGIKGGYIEAGFSNIVSNEAEAKFNFRFPPEHEPEAYLRKFEMFLKNNLPDYVRYQWQVVTKGKGSRLNLNARMKEELETILKKIYHRKVLYKHVGGSLPIITDFKEILKTPILSLPLANEDSNMHGVGENFRIDYLLKALKVSRELLSTPWLEKAL